MSEIMDWQTLREHLARYRPSILDLRDTQAYAAGHLPGSAHWPIAEPLPRELPADVMPTYLLPPRHVPLVLVGARAGSVSRLVAWLSARGRESVAGAVLDWQEGCGNRLERGTTAARLWRPPPWLAEHAGLLPAPDVGRAVDLGCGNGRAAVWLAEQGYRVTAVDRHAEALTLAENLARSLALALDCRQADLTDPAQWPAGPWSLAVAHRFLHRPLLRGLRASVRSGGIVVARTFRWEEGPWVLPRERFCLRHGELRELFATPHWEILAHREDADDDGRPASGVVARRS